jgi:hypothetical protein
MSFMVYLAVLIATVFSIALEWGSLVERPQVAYHAEQAQAPAGVPPPAAPMAREAAPEQPAGNKAAASVPAAPPLSSPPIAAPAQPSVKCDVDACAAAYRTFRASDCTYNSSSGRRLCTKGQPPQ